MNIPIDVLNGFIAINSNYRGDKITSRTESVQRIKIFHMEEHFNALKNGNLTSDEKFYNQFAKDVV